MIIDTVNSVLLNNKILCEKKLNETARRKKKRIEEELMQKISFAPGADTDIRRN